MSLEIITRTSIWKNSLLARVDDPFEKERELLRQNLLSFRDKASHIVSQISRTVPELTIHDITHLDGLWETASLIVGESYELNALEAFVLGGAILLHDSALCYEAYQNGLSGIRDSLTWKDIYASLDQVAPEDERLKLADFAALRASHADQSSQLVNFSWTTPDSDGHIYLIDHPTLRNHLGELIGKIAASHHWDLDKIPSLGTQFNAIQGFPAEWRINPVKIACLLRCADAAHISADRAPDFLYALLNRNGISFNHWQSQNRLAGPDINSSDPAGETLIYTSTRPFREHESKSWWIAFDLVSLVDQEIKASNDLIESEINKSTTFKIKGIKGARSIKELKQHVQTVDWDPIDSKIHVSNLEKLVSNLGGEQLYASNTSEHKFQVAIRELIQNARDSIKARYALDQDFTGKITVKIVKIDGRQVLTVEDNGLGMSQRVLTGPLLDFGSSFWASSLVRSEFPGLANSSFKSVGRFGIGFYAIFMVADKVAVATKPWQQGLDKTMQLIFSEGLSLRPLFKPSPPPGFKFSVNCQVELVLKEGLIDDSLMFETIDQTILKQTFKVPIQDYLARLCAGLDVNLYYSDGISETRIHTSIDSPEFDIRSWLHKISFSDLQSTTLTKDIIDSNFTKIRRIENRDKLLGLAAFNLTGGDFIGVHTIGGFTTNPMHKNSNRHIGFIELSPNSAKRDAGEPAATKELLKSWAQEQLALTDISALDLHSNGTLTDLLCEHEIDPKPFAIVCTKNINGFHTMTFTQLVSYAHNNPVAIFVVQYFNFVEPHSVPNSYLNYLIVQPISMGKFYTYKFEDGQPDNTINLFSLLNEEIKRLGKKPVWTRVPTQLRSQTYQNNLDAIVLTVENVESN